MRIILDIPESVYDDLKALADYHAVPVDDVVRHYITDGIESEKIQQLGPWEAISRAEAKRPLPPDVLVDALQDTVHTDVRRTRIAGTVRQVK